MTAPKPTRRKFLKTSAVASAAAGSATLGAPLIAKGAAKHTIKIATLAPDGSSWHKAFKKLSRSVKETTEGAVDIKIYAGGVMGDEPAMIRKVRTGQLDGAACTSVGLGEINKQVLMLQLPLLFDSYKRLDYVREKMAPTFASLFEKGGFHIGSWGDVGFLYLFTNSPVKTPLDLKSLKFWVWDADFVTKATAKVAGVNGVELGVPDVLPSLQTGVINAFAASPYAAIALQWYTKAAYVTNLRLAMGVGASVISAKTWGSLDDEYKEVINEANKDIYGSLLKRIRRDNKKAVQTLQDKGIKVVEPEDFAAWTDVAIRVKKALVGKEFDEALVAEMEGHIKAAGK